MGDDDSSTMLYCSEIFFDKIPFASRGLGNSCRFAHDSAAAFLSIYKKQQKITTKNGGMTAVLYYYSLVG